MYNPDADQTVELLKQSYATAPDPAFSADLLDRLGAQLPEPRSAWHMRRLALAASIAFACIIGAGLYLRYGPVTPPLANDQPVMPATIAANRDPPATIGETKRLMERFSTAEMVGRVPFWVRCRLIRFESPLAHYRVVYPIYGDFPDDTVTVDLSVGPSGRNLAELADPDRDVVLQLRPHTERSLLTATPGVKYQYSGTHYRADETEAEILQGITDGSSFELNPRLVDQQMIDAQLIVRAQLVLVAGGESTWKILRVLRGVAQSETLVLDDQFFRQRAKAILAAAARKLTPPPATQGPALTQPSTQVATQLIDAETSRLARSELPLPTEAILFVDQVQAKAESIHGRLRYRAYEDAQKQKLDALQKAIDTQPNSKGRQL